MKKVGLLLLCCFVLASLVGCSTSGGNSETGTTTTAAATTTTAATTTAATTTTTAADGDYITFTEGKMSFQLPSNFKRVSEDGAVMFVTDGYPDEVDSVNFVITPKDAQFSDISEEQLAEQLAGVLDAFEKTTIDGKPAIIMTYSISAMDINMTMTQVMIDADQTYTLMYTMADGNLKDHVEASIQSITFAD